MLCVVGRADSSIVYLGIPDPWGSRPFSGGDCRKGLVHVGIRPSIASHWWTTFSWKGSIWPSSPSNVNHYHWPIFFWPSVTDRLLSFKSPPPPPLKTSVLVRDIFLGTNEATSLALALVTTAKRVD